MKYSTLIFTIICLFPFYAEAQNPPVYYNDFSNENLYAPPPGIAEYTPSPTKGKLLYKWDWGFNFSLSMDSSHVFGGGGTYLRYMFNQRWGIEGNLMGMGGDSKVNQYTTRSIGRTSLLLVRALNDAVESGRFIYVKGGFSKLYNDYDSNYVNYSEHKDINYKGLELGVGVSWNISMYFALRLDCVIFFPIETMDDGQMPSALLINTAGVSIRF